LWSVAAGACLAADDNGGGSGDPNQSVCNKVFGFTGTKLSCGLLFGPNLNLGSSKVVTASVVNGLVRASEDRDLTLTGFGEVHHVWALGGGVNAGIFAGVGASGTSNTTASFAIGPIILLPKNKNNAYGFDVAVGVSFLPNQQVLGDGIFENKPLPAGETAVRYKTTTTIGTFFGVGVHF
jgi:hypothetical protein